MRAENILTRCLVESNPEKLARERRARRRALVVAIILQVLLVGLLVLAPLLGAAEKLTARIVTPTVPFKGSPKPSEPRPAQQPQGSRKPPALTGKTGLVAPLRVPHSVSEVNDPPEAFAVQPGAAGSATIGDPNGILGLDAAGNRRAAIPKPAEPDKNPAPKPRQFVSEGVQAARLIWRVEPKYPPFARSAGMEGKVVLRAIIGKDGTIQSLEVLSGSPLFVAAAREAIAQWRYQPTLLHGEPVEVETVISVIFIMRR